MLAFTFPTVSTQPLRDALVEYDRTQPARDKLWDDIVNEYEYQVAQDANGEALRKVREAFYEVTKDRNSYDSCMKVDIKFARQIAELDTL